MPKKKTKRLHKIKRSNWKRFIPWTLFVSALLIGAFAIPSNLLNQNTKKTPPKIDSISPSPLVINKEFTVTGSGFTTEDESKGPPRTGGVLIGYSGNWYQIKGSLQGPPAFSPDGRTLTFPALNIDSRDIPQNCQTETTGKKCQVSFQVLSSFGVPSNAKQIEIFIPEIKPQIFSSTYTQDSPANLNVAAGARDVEVLRIKVRADVQNDSDIIVDGIMIQTGPATLAIDCSNTFGYFRAFEVESGRELGVGGMYPNWANSGCLSMPPFLPVVNLPPGTEKTILVKMTLGSTAQVGLQFNLGATPSPGGYIQWVDYPGPTGSGPAITIVAPYAPQSI